jgi:hypothetical protein
MTSTEITEQDIAALIARWSEATQRYIDGDLRGYAAIVRHAEDYTLLPPNGGDARSGFDSSDDAVEWTARTFRGGQFELDVVKTYTLPRPRRLGTGRVAPSASPGTPARRRGDIAPRTRRHGSDGSRQRRHARRLVAARGVRTRLR